MKKLITICAVVTMILAVSGVAQALVLNNGYLVNATDEGSVRYKDLAGTNNNPDMYVGIDGLGTAGNRNQFTFFGTGDNWLDSPSVDHVEFIYDKADDELIASVTANSLHQLIWSNFSTTMPDPLDALNYLQIGMKGNSAGGGTVTMQNILLDGQSIQSIQAGATYTNWYLSGYDFSNGFDLTADLVLAGTLGANENGKVDISFGQVPEPATMALLGLGGLSLLRRKRSKA